MKRAMASRNCGCVAALIFVLLGSTGARGGIILPGVPDEQYQAYGQMSSFQSVGWVAATNSSGSFVVGSGVLISPEWMLTAGHVITSQTGLTGLKFSLTPSVYGGPPNYAVADSWQLYPGYTASTPLGSGVDLALVHLSAPVTSVVPATIYQGPVTLNSTVSIIGYGENGVYGTGITSFDGVKRGGENRIDNLGIPGFGIEGQYAVTHFDVPPWPMLPMEFGGAPGDSGGGWFIDVNGQQQLVAVSSFAFGDSLTGGLLLNDYNSWIVQTTTSPVPEPSSLAMTLTIVPALVFYYRKRGKKDGKQVA